jgi:hypothetical protein
MLSSIATATVGRRTESQMDNYRPSRFDRMLESVDAIIRDGFTFVTGDETPPFEELIREWERTPRRAELGCDD